MGSGKSTVAQLFRAKGALIIDADALARDALKPGEPAYQSVMSHFGEQVLLANGEIDRGALARAVFADAGQRETLERMVHPVVAARRSEILANAPGDAIVIEDIPLLVEKNLHTDYDFVIVVSAPESLRLTRLIQERQVPEAEALRRMGTQASDEARAAVADAIIDNSGTKAQLEKRVEDVWLQLQRLKHQS